MSRAARLLSRLCALAGTALCLAGLGAFGVYAWSEVRLARRYPVLGGSAVIPGDAASRERGRYLVRVLAQCDLCHGADLGGAPVADDPGVGTLWAANLTRGRGGTAELAAADWLRALRYGIGRDGRALVLMPAQHLRRLSAADVAAIVSYLRNVPPVDRSVPPRRAGWKTRLALVLGLAPGLLPAEQIDLDAPPPTAPPSERDAAYGGYLVDLGGCRVCHHESLAGGSHPLALPGELPVPNLTPAGRLRDWSEAEFISALRSGEAPDGRRLDPTLMPWPAFAQLGDVELGAIWLYLRALPPRPTGSL